MSGAPRSGGAPRQPGTFSTIRATGTVTRRGALRHSVQPGPKSVWIVSVVGIVLAVAMAGVILAGLGDDRGAGHATASPSGSPIAAHLQAI